MPTLVLLDPPYVFWDRAMDHIRDVMEMCCALACAGTRHTFFYDDLFTVSKQPRSTR